MAVVFKRLYLGQQLVIGGIIGTCVVCFILDHSGKDLQRRRYNDAVQLISSGQVSERAFRVVNSQIQIPQALQNARPSFAPRPFLDDIWTPKFVQQNMILNRENLQAGRWYTLLTSGFSHANFSHLALNMMSFASIAPPLIATIGTPAFLGIWIASSITAGAVSIRSLDYKRRDEDNGARPIDTNFLGASASVLGLFAARSVLFPHTTIGILFIPYSFSAPNVLTGLFVGSIIAEFNGWLPWLGHLGHASGIAVGAIAGYAIRRIMPLRSSAMMLPLLATSLSDRLQLQLEMTDSLIDELSSKTQMRAS